jgi:hypothetical protein
MKRVLLYKAINRYACITTRTLSNKSNSLPPQQPQPPPLQQPPNEDAAFEILKSHISSIPNMEEEQLNQFIRQMLDQSIDTKTKFAKALIDAQNNQIEKRAYLDIMIAPTIAFFYIGMPVPFWIVAGCGFGGWYYFKLCLQEHVNKYLRVQGELLNSLSKNRT